MINPYLPIDKQNIDDIDINEEEDEKERENFIAMYGEDPEDVLGSNWQFKLNTL